MSPICLNMTWPAASVVVKTAKLRKFMNFCIGAGGFQSGAAASADITDPEGEEAAEPDTACFTLIPQRGKKSRCHRRSPSSI
jgi:hypothetical protein